MINKAISGLYPPGSTIKTLTALSALENDVVSLKLIVRCKGYMIFMVKDFTVGKKKVMVSWMRTALKNLVMFIFMKLQEDLE